MPWQSWDSLGDWNALTLSLTPAGEKKQTKKKTKKCPDRAGFVHEPRVEPGLERIPLFWGCVMSRFWRFISKVRKAVLLKGGWRLQLFFKRMQKWTNKHIRVQWSEGLDHRIKYMLLNLHMRPCSTWPLLALPAPSPAPPCSERDSATTQQLFFVSLNVKSSLTVPLFFLLALLSGMLLCSTFFPLCVSSPLIHDFSKPP